MPETELGFLMRFRELWRDHPYLMALSLALAITIGAAVGIQLYVSLFVAAASTGDEPPIRVRGGSIYLDLIAPDDADNTWDPDSGDNTWKARSGKRKDDNLGFAVLTSNTTNPCPASAHDVKVISFEFTPTPPTPPPPSPLPKKAYEIRSSGKKTRVSGEGLQPFGRRLTNSVPGAVTAMTYQLQSGGTTTCSLNEHDIVVIFDWE
jgi:hypothetical protein